MPDLEDYIDDVSFIQRLTHCPKCGRHKNYRENHLTKVSNTWVGGKHGEEKHVPVADEHGFLYRFTCMNCGHVWGLKRCSKCNGKGNSGKEMCQPCNGAGQFLEQGEGVES